MGICNVTPDSFSDGGRFFDVDSAKTHVDELIAAGADIIDIGGESTRPGSQSVPPRQQLERVLPVIRHAAQRGACVSIDTASAEVAAACLDAGAHAINDVSLLRDEELARVAAGSAASLVLSHARAPQDRITGYGGWSLEGYGDVVADVVVEWERAAARAVELGLCRSALVIDPGLGFSKASRHSFELLRRVGELVRRVAQNGEVPILVGASRKSFLTLVEPNGSKSEPADRDGASISAALHAVRAGATILRVHDVRATRQAIDMEIVLGTPRRKI
jgi:dihydropteroate synthase